MVPPQVATSATTSSPTGPGTVTTTAVKLGQSFRRSVNALWKVGSRRWISWRRLPGRKQTTGPLPAPGKWKPISLTNSLTKHILMTGSSSSLQASISEESTQNEWLNTSYRNKSMCELLGRSTRNTTQMSGSNPPKSTWRI